MKQAISIVPHPSKIEHKGMKFLITDRPTDDSLSTYIEELERNNAKEVVRVCEPSYGTGELVKRGIHVKDLMFDDGSCPPMEVVDEWFTTLRDAFSSDPNSCVAVHCVAGLGRAPVLVALALIEGGMKYEDAVEMIRQKRRGAINSRQLDYLQRYRPKSRLKKKNGTKNSSCCVM